VKNYIGCTGSPRTVLEGVFLQSEIDAILESMRSDASPSARRLYETLVHSEPTLLLTEKAMVI